jgi:hypothetical protein
MKFPVLCATLAGLCAIFLEPTSGFAQSTTNQTPPRSIDVKKVLGYYDLYLRLPAQERDGFNLSYVIKSGSTGLRPQMTYVLGTVRIPIQVAQNGKVLTMPDLNMFRRGKIEIPAGQPSASISMNLEAVVPLSRAISAADASNAVSDYAAALRHAGPLALMAPKLPALLFKGSAGGQAVFADGRRLPLPNVAGGVRFEPGAPTMRGVASLIFTSAPTQVEFAR